MAIESVVFDVDGVLVRSFEFGKILERDHGVDSDTQLEFWRGPFQDCVRGQADVKEAVAPFLEQWRWPATVDDFLATWFEADSATNDEVLRTVPVLRRAGYRCWVASTQEAYRAEYLERHIGLGDLFDGLFFSCRVGTTKGDVTFFRHATERIGAPAEGILFFDDAEAIVETARSAGWNAEVYRFGDDIQQLLSRYGVSIPDA
jgi:putative hydrolase of the HAD superfamily